MFFQSFRVSSSELWDVFPEKVCMAPDTKAVVLQSLLALLYWHVISPCGVRHVTSSLT